MAKKAREKVQGSENISQLDWLTRPTRGADWENKTQAEQFLQQKTTFTFKPKISEYIAPAKDSNSPVTPKKSEKKVRMPHSGSKCLDLFYYAKQLQKERKQRDVSTEEKDFLSSKKELTFKPNLSLTRSVSSRISLVTMSENKLFEIKGAKDLINRIRVGRTLREYERESRITGVHINDSGIALLSELSKKNHAELPKDLTKKYAVTRPTALHYSPSKSEGSLINNEPVNIVTNYSPQESPTQGAPKTSSPEKTPKVKRMKRNISAKGNLRRVTFDSAKSAKSQ